MSVDREQVRRDAEHVIGAERMEGTLAQACLALLAELEQAEADRDEARRIAGVWSRKRDYTLQTKLELEARLAKVPALVEALKRVHPGHGPTGFAPQVSTCQICAALAEWESE